MALKASHEVFKVVIKTLNKTWPFFLFLFLLDQYFIFNFTRLILEKRDSNTRHQIGIINSVVVDAEFQKLLIQLTV